MSQDHAEAMQNRLRADLREAMRARQPLEVSVLRGLIGALDNAAAVPVERPAHYVPSQPFGSGTEVPRLRLSDGDVQAVLARQIEVKAAAAEELDRHGQGEEAEKLRRDAAIVNRYCDRAVSST